MQNTVAPNYSFTNREFTAYGPSALCLLDKMGWSPNKHDKMIIAECESVRDVMTRLSESQIIQKLFLAGSSTGQGRLGEFYAALLSESRYEPSAGFDLYGAYRFLEMIKAGTVEVKTCISAPGNRWRPRITGTSCKVEYDVLVVLGMTSYNPCKSHLFVIPAHILEPIAKLRVRQQKNKQPDRQNDIPRIDIYKRPLNVQSGQKNKWWEYEIAKHSQLRDAITRYIHGDFSITPQQLAFDF